MKKNTMVKQFISLLLAAVMVLFSQGGAGWPTGTVKAYGATLPENPVHHCTKQDDGTDDTEWNYVYFGSYPQTEVTGSALTSAITGASYDANGDAWVNGKKYRRISNRDTNNNTYFGYSPYRYFKWQRIKWRVLQNDGSTLFVVSDRALDCKKYDKDGKNEDNTPLTWESCDLRGWLNGTFYNAAFSSEEQGAIVEQVVVNEDNPYYKTEAGNDTTDKVFLLSISEVTNPAYGFCENYKTESVSRAVKNSDFAHIMGAYSAHRLKHNDWWLRSPGNRSVYAAYVFVDGSVMQDGISVGYDSYSVVPALRINLSSNFWFTVNDEINEEENSEEEDNEDTQNVKVNKLSISAISKKIAAGQKVTLEVAVSPQNAANSKVKWKTGNPKYATVNSRGVVTTKRAGKGKKVKITAEAMDGSGKKATIELKLMKNAVTKVQIGEVKKPLKAGKTMTLKAKIKTNGKDVNKTLKWSVSNEKYASVNAKGKVTARKAGKGKTVTVTAMSTDGTGKKAKVRIKIR